MAQVEDVWGRTQQLLVVCAPDQTPERVLQQLSSKALGQHKYWVHVFNTHQPPWRLANINTGYMSSTPTSRLGRLGLCMWERWVLEEGGIVRVVVVDVPILIQSMGAITPMASLMVP